MIRYPSGPILRIILIRWSAGITRNEDLRAYMEIQKPTKKRLTWSLIRRLCDMDNLPWLMGGDFNEIMFDYEKNGGYYRARNLLEEFRNTLDDCHLKDMGFSGNIFTWKGNRRGHHIWERLDRFISNPSFDNLFENVKAQHLEWIYFNHRPIEVELNSQRMRRRRGQSNANGMFKFEELWTRREECHELIKSNRECGNTVPFNLKNNLQSCS